MKTTRKAFLYIANKPTSRTLKLVGIITKMEAIIHPSNFDRAIIHNHNKSFKLPLPIEPSELKLIIERNETIKRKSLPAVSSDAFKLTPCLVLLDDSYRLHLFTFMAYCTSGVPPQNPGIFKLRVLGRVDLQVLGKRKYRELTKSLDLSKKWPCNTIDRRVFEP